MNFLSVFALVLGFSVPLSASEKADFICVDENGNRYDYYNDKQELRQFGPNYKKGARLKSLTLEEKVIFKANSQSSVDLYSLYRYEAYKPFLIIRFKDDSSHGKGHYNDKKVDCIR